VRRTLAEAPGRFAGVRNHQATEDALAAAVGELSNVGRRGLDAIAEAGGFSAGVVDLHRGVRTRLRGFHDEADLARASTHRADDWPAHRYPCRTAILPTGLRPPG